MERNVKEGIGQRRNIRSEDMTRNIKKYKGWEIKLITKGKSKGLLFAEKSGTSFGLLGDNYISSIEKEIDRREKLSNVI